jgi:hypothetical protein
MSIESYLERIAASLEKLANVTDETPTPEKPVKAVDTKPSKASKPAPNRKAKPAPTKTEKVEKEDAGDNEESGATLTEVRKALAGLQKRVDAAAAKGILKEVGEAATLSKLDPDNYQAVIDAANAAE